MSAENLSQGRVKQMRCRMIERNRGAALLVDLCLDSIADSQLAGVEHSYMGYRSADSLSVSYSELHVAGSRHPHEQTRVADLAAAFGIKRSMVEHDLTFLARS